MKYCGSCKSKKEEKEFHFKSKEKSILQSMCKRCMHDKQMYRWRMQKVKAIKYLGSKCRNCEKEDYPIEVYQFHHRDRSSKLESWNTLRLKSWSKIVKELDKCDLLCANCHIIAHSKDPEEYGQKYKSQRDKKIYKCKKCNTILACNKANLCRDCNAEEREVIKWPPISNLLEMIKNSNYSEVGRKLGVSDNAIRKRIKKYLP